MCLGRRTGCHSLKLAKADIVPTDTNLRSQYASFAEVEAACSAFTAEINPRVHRSTGRLPAEMLTEERPRLHAVPDLPHTAALGVTRRVPDNTPVAVQPVGDPVAIEAQQRWPRSARHHELSTGEMHPPAQDRHCFEKYRCAHLISPTDTW